MIADDCFMLLLSLTLQRGGEDRRTYRPIDLGIGRNFYFHAQLFGKRHDNTAV